MPKLLLPTFLMLLNKHDCSLVIQQIDCSKTVAVHRFNDLCDELKSAFTKKKNYKNKSGL